MPTLIQNQQRRRVNTRFLRRAIKETLVAEGVSPRAVEISLALVDDATMQDLNKRYRGKDTPTDVLSFTQEDGIALPGVPRLLGDVVISVDTALRQADTAGHSLDDEAAQLAIHGILHLLGYDDVSPEGYAEMVGKGAQIWQRLTHIDAQSDAGSSGTDEPDAQ